MVTSKMRKATYRRPYFRHRNTCPCCSVCRMPRCTVIFIGHQECKLSGDADRPYRNYASTARWATRSRPGRISTHQSTCLWTLRQWPWILGESGPRCQSSRTAKQPNFSSVLLSHRERCCGCRTHHTRRRFSMGVYRVRTCYR